MICLDDLNDWVGCLEGHPQAYTPNIDKLAAKGTLFTNAHCQAPRCNPSRISVLSGLNPTKTGIYDNRYYWAAALPNLETLPRYFKKQGYRVEGGGKIFHHNPGQNPRDQWHYYFKQQYDDPYHRYPAGSVNSLPLEPKAEVRWPKGFPLNNLSNVKNAVRPPYNPREFDWGPLDRTIYETGDGKTVAWAEQFLDVEHEDPFFLAVGIFRPHLPWYAPKEFFDRFPVEDIILPKIKENDLDDVPEEGKKIALRKADSFTYIKQEKRYKEAVQAYLASTSYADHLVGMILEGLEKSPYAKNTIVVLWSDHGWHLGEKGHWHKGTLWERSTRVPFIVYDTRKANGGNSSARPVGLVDLFPTLIDLCNTDKRHELDGQSLVPLMKSPKRTWERPALTVFQRPGNYALRSDDFRYIKYWDGSEEFYDHRVDPNEWNNVATDPEYSQEKKKMATWFPQKAVKSAPPKDDYKFDPWSYTFERKKK